MKSTIYSLTVLITGSAPLLIQAQENRNSRIGIEFGYNGHIFNQGNSITFKSIEANYSYDSQAFVNGRLNSNDITFSDEFVSPFISKSLTVTKSWPSKLPNGYWTGKIGINVTKQEARITVQSYSIGNSTNKQEATNISYSETNPMMNLSLERRYLLMPTENKLNIYVVGGIDGGLGFGSKLRVTGETHDYYSENGELSNSVYTSIDERGFGTNGYSYGGHIGCGPQISINKLIAYCSFNFFLAKIRKVNTATYEVLNSGLSVGLVF